MSIDMSPQAVTARLKLTSQLRHLCLALGKTRRPEPAQSGFGNNEGSASEINHSQPSSPVGSKPETER